MQNMKSGIVYYAWYVILYNGQAFYKYSYSLYVAYNINTSFDPKKIILKTDICAITDIGREMCFQTHVLI